MLARTRTTAKGASKAITACKLSQKKLGTRLRPPNKPNMGEQISSIAVQGRFKGREKRNQRAVYKNKPERRRRLKSGGHGRKRSIPVYKKKFTLHDGQEG